MLSARNWGWRCVLLWRFSRIYAPYFSLLTVKWLSKWQLYQVSYFSRGRGEGFSLSSQCSMYLCIGYMKNTSNYVLLIILQILTLKVIASYSFPYPNSPFQNQMLTVLKSNFHQNKHFGRSKSLKWATIRIMVNFGNLKNAL